MLNSDKPSIIAAYTGVMAAIYYALLWLPGIPVIGVPTLKMNIGAAFSPILGVILGPYLGAFAALVGNVVKSLTPPSIHAIPFIFCPMVCALNAGFLSRGRIIAPIILLSAILITASFTPVFYPLTEYGYVYILAFFDKIAALLLVPVAAWLIRGKSSWARRIGLFLVMFISRETDKALACTIFALPQVHHGIFGVPSIDVARKLYMVSPFLYPAIYVLESLIAFIVAVPLIRVLARIPTLSELTNIRLLSKRI